MSYRTEFDYTIPESKLETERYVASGSRKITSDGRRYSYGAGIWAQDGVRQHSRVDYYCDLDDPGSSLIAVVNGEVMKLSSRPDLMTGGIDRMDKFKWYRIGPQPLGLRPMGYYKLSELLTPGNAIIHEQTELIGDRETFVVDSKRPHRDYSFYARIWIDCERYMPLKIALYGHTNPSSPNANPHKEVIGIKLHQLPNGGWFPVEGTEIWYRQEPRARQGLYHRVVDVNSITIQREDIPESLFEIDFPEGARIYNAILGVRGVQGRGGHLIVEESP